MLYNVSCKCSKKENVGITIEPKSIENEELGINAATVNMVSFSVIGLLPLVVILLGIFMFLKRRHLWASVLSLIFF